MEKEIKKKYLNGAICNYVRMFRDQDEDYPDNRKIAIHERNYHYNLDKMTDDKNIRQEVQEVIETYWCGDSSIGEILKEKGYTLGD